ncbi:hypothetical protein DL764_006110 [Monosporascus ibericus]|uniref:NACHT domain-containing protein n=1 Tax=Monosporascus ibericus TaxID=155417 RepID=A0A4Q4T944_9PEZI|nr:hypothetical protein DL764_006110 [Monosporascus ibericus]
MPRRLRDDPDSRLLWIKSDPGKGRTMLLCGIIDELTEQTANATRLLSFFFCQATDDRLNNATGVLRGLIYLLVDRQPPLVSHIQKKYNHAGKALFEGVNAWVALREIFINMLQDPGLPNITLIVDALNECETDLLRFLELIIKVSTRSRIKWLLSSRNRIDIEQKLQPDHSRTRLNLELKSNADHVSHAVDAYIDHCISEIPAIQDNPQLQTRVRDQMRRKADARLAEIALDMATVDACRAPFAQYPSPPFSEEAMKQTALAHFEEYLSRPVDDKPFVAEDTQKERDRLWQNWTRFCETVSIDNRTAWLRFVAHPETADARAPFKSFLHTYAETSAQKRVVLGPQEYEYKRMVNSAFTVTEIWRRLVACGEHHVMQQHRRDVPSQADTWRLRWISKEEGSREGPAYRIVKWIFVELAGEIGLETAPTYEKTEATPTDVHVAVLRDPENRSRTKIVISVWIERNKIKETSKTSRSRNGGWIRFDVTLVPNCSFCLASKVLTRAIQDRAFEPSFNNVDEIFDRPNLESVDFVQLRWKRDILNQRIFPITYKTLNELWHRTLLVSGFRTHSRLYSLRVGAGARFDGVLSSALRNYILSHTTGVFESSYQSHRVRANLMSLAFGKDAGRDDKLFAMLRDMSVSRDANAPVDITMDEHREFEQRKDVSGLRHEIATVANGNERTKLRAKLHNLLKTLRKLKLDEKRDEYFHRVDYLRAQACEREGVNRANIIDGLASWHMHLEIAHTGWGYGGRTSAEGAKTGRRRGKHEEAGDEGYGKLDAQLGEANLNASCLDMDNGSAMAFLETPPVPSSPLSSSSLSSIDTEALDFPGYGAVSPLNFGSESGRASPSISTPLSSVTDVENEGKLDVFYAKFNGEASEEHPHGQDPGSSETRPTQATPCFNGLETAGCYDKLATVPRYDDSSRPLPRTASSIPMELIDPALRNDAPEPMEGIITTHSAGADLDHLHHQDSPKQRHNDDDVDDGDRGHSVDRILERWKQDQFLLRWADDGSCWWVPRENILDKELVQKFEAEYRGFRLGVTVLRTRKRNGKTEYRAKTLKAKSHDTAILAASAVMVATTPRLDASQINPQFTKNTKPSSPTLQQHAKQQRHVDVELPLKINL